MKPMTVIKIFQINNVPENRDLNYKIPFRKRIYLFIYLFFQGIQFTSFAILFQWQIELLIKLHDFSSLHFPNVSCQPSEFFMM